MPTTTRSVRHTATLDEARATLRRHFGYPDFRPPQIRAIEAVIGGGDALLVLPTGGGKSLCYQVPALMRPGLTIVVSPLISLMKDQVETLERRRISAAYLNSTLSGGEVDRRMAQMREGTLKLLYLAPERLQADRLLAQLAGVGVALFAIDEAHCISEWGHDFRPSYRQLGEMRQRLGGPQTVALTATATPDVRADIARQLALRAPTVVVAGFDRTNLTYHVARTPTLRDKDNTAMALLRQAEGPCVVYAPTRKAVERITATLVRGRIRATAYHAGLDGAVRQRSQEAFMEERARVIVATNAFGMGIDKPDVRLVVHHAMPGSLEAYYQEAGRAGRDGAASSCVLLYSFPDRFTHEYFIAHSHPSRRTVETTWHVLRAAADAGGCVVANESALRARLPAGTDVRSFGAALRVLTAAGALTVTPPAHGRVFVRLLASPARIVRELTGPRDMDREVLRTLWRAVGEPLRTGARVDLDGLPPGFGGSMALVPVLERLEAEQFVTFMKQGAGYQLDARWKHPAWLPVDWVHLERRHQSELRRLDAMQGYAQTRYCRRAFVLRYFGDPEARSHCGACDRCLSPTESGAPFFRTRASGTRSRPRSSSFLPPDRT